jgi:hypothetical protein
MKKKWDVRILKYYATGLDGSYVVDIYGLAKVNYTANGKIQTYLLLDKDTPINLYKHSSIDNLKLISKLIKNALKQPILDKTELDTKL